MSDEQTPGIIEDAAKPKQTRARKQADSETVATETAKPVTESLQAQSKQGKVVVSALQASRWRCGIQFTRDPVELNVSELGADVLKLLQADPKLKVMLF